MLVLEFSEFRKMDLIKKLSNKLEGTFEHVKSGNKYIYASSKLDRSGKPLVRIDSKEDIKGLFLEIGKDYIKIKSIVNKGNEPGLVKKVIDIIRSLTNCKIIIEKDQSSGFWEYFIKKYPNINFEIVD